VRRSDLLANVSTVVKGALATGVSVVAMLSVLAIFVGETEVRTSGFLPWPTSWGDRFFVSLLIFFLISLLWLKFVEPFIPIYGALVLGLIIGFFFIKYG
jgi:predicted small integral membrane protein